MPYPVRIQPIDVIAPHEFEPSASAKPVFLKSRFKRLLERQFSRNSAADKPVGAAEPLQRDGSEEFEPSSVCLARMVQNYIEESNEKPQQKCGRNRCNCFNGYYTDSSDEQMDSVNSSSADACEVLKSLVICLNGSERNLLADTVKIVEKNKISKRKDECCRKIVVDGLIALGYNASICKSEWEKSLVYPAGNYDYVDVTIEGERLVIDIDFRSEFEIARSTKAYRLILQTLPTVFVGKPDRLERIINIVSEAAKQSLKKKGMPLPPWRRAEYVKAKWLSPFTRIGRMSTSNICKDGGSITTTEKKDSSITIERKNSSITTEKKSCSCDGELDLLFGDDCSPVEKQDNRVFVLSNSNSNSNSSSCSPVVNSDGGVKKWEPPEIRPKTSLKGVKIVTGLASVIEDN